MSNSDVRPTIDSHADAAIELAWLFQVAPLSVRGVDMSSGGGVPDFVESAGRKHERMGEIIGDVERAASIEAALQSLDPSDGRLLRVAFDVPGTAHAVFGMYAAQHAMTVQIRAVKSLDKQGSYNVCLLRAATSGMVVGVRDVFPERDQTSDASTLSLILKAAGKRGPVLDSAKAVVEAAVAGALGRFAESHSAVKQQRARDRANARMVRVTGTSADGLAALRREQELEDLARRASEESARSARLLGHEHASQYEALRESRGNRS